jgi:hypothetical protein
MIEVISATMAGDKRSRSFTERSIGLLQNGTRVQFSAAGLANGDAPFSEG